jgi:hypothetical protein
MTGRGCEEYSHGILEEDWGGFRVLKKKEEMSLSLQSTSATSDSTTNSLQLLF